MKHTSQADLALYSAGDLAPWKRVWIGVHVSGCRDCRQQVDAYRAGRERLRAMSAELPSGLSWDRLSAEMAANIRVGLAAGECVASRATHRVLPSGWRIAGAVAGFCALLAVAWWLNMPAAQTASLERAMKAVANGREWQARQMMGIEEGSSLVQASADGIELRENGSALTLSQKGARPVSVSLNTQGSARARYIDSDTGQVTITGVYAQ